MRPEAQTTTRRSLVFSVDALEIVTVIKGTLENSDFTFEGIEYRVWVRLGELNVKL